MRLFGTLKKGATGDEFLAENIGDYQLELISLTVCDSEGKTLYSVDDVDSWAEEDNGGAKIVAYTKAINEALAPTAGKVAGN